MDPHPPSRPNCWFSSSQGIYYTSHPWLKKDFQRLKESHFRSKILVILVPNFGIGANQSVPWDVFLFYHWKRCGKFDHMPPRVFERQCLNAIFTRSIFCRSLSGTASPLWSRKQLVGKTCKYSTNLYNPGSYTCASFDVSLTPQKHAVL